MALSVLVSQSRGGALALLAGSIVFWLLRSRGAPLGRRGVLAAACVGAVVVGMWTVLPAEAKQRLVGILGSPDVSGQYRLGVWRDALSAFRHSPWLGQGIGVFEDALPRFKTVAGHLRVEHAENELLELLVEGGLVASLLAGLAVVGVARSVMRKVADRPVAPTKGEVAGAVAGLAALLTHSVFDFSLHIPATLTVAAFLLAVVLARQFREGSGAGRAPGVLAVLVLTSALAVSLRTRVRRELCKPSAAHGTLHPGANSACTVASDRASADEHRSNAAGCSRRLGSSRLAARPAWRTVGCGCAREIRGQARSTASGPARIRRAAHSKALSATLSRPFQRGPGRRPIARQPRPGRRATSSKPMAANHSTISSFRYRYSMGATSRSNCSATSIRNGMFS